MVKLQLAPGSSLLLFSKLLVPVLKNWGLRSSLVLILKKPRTWFWFQTYFWFRPGFGLVFTNQCNVQTMLGGFKNLYEEPLVPNLKNKLQLCQLQFQFLFLNSYSGFGSSFLSRIMVSVLKNQSCMISILANWDSTVNSWSIDSEPGFQTL
jgi:hypothetical protein